MLIPINPYTGKELAGYESIDNEAELHHRIGLAQMAFPEWSAHSFKARGDALRRLATELRRQKPVLTELMAQEMGKPVKEGGLEVEKSAFCADYYADQAEQFLARQNLQSDASSSYVEYQPLGVVLGILPWNAPLWLAFRFLAPALMAGNTCLLKHDPHVPGCAKALADAIEAAALPHHVVENLPLPNHLVQAAIADKRVQAVSFTGSSASGRRVAIAAAEQLKPAVLELGGSDPCIVLADANLEKAADVVTLSRIINAGQSCIAAKRILIEAPVYAQFTTLLQTRLEKLTLGDPLKPDTDIGPLARQDLRDNLHRQVQQTIAAGAKCLLGGTLPNGPGFLYPPTLLTDVQPGMCAFEEETFGPVMCLTPVDNFTHAMQLANQTDYGLGASIWTASPEKAEHAARHLVAGQVAINGIVKTDPRLPSGGVKQSGYGRELGPHGIREFVNVKQVWVG
ncbi:MAG: NAD-dependent succinate-semialdehyde dehydrogenase [Limnobacter sp.]|nr:NAD-dependent succinate-semialdehyde dehydrogenase [Limnobacter sp.]